MPKTFDRTHALKLMVLLGITLLSFVALYAPFDTGGEDDRDSHKAIDYGDSPPITEAHDLEWTKDAHTLRVTGDKPWFVLPTQTSLKSITHIELRAVPRAAFNYSDFIVYFVPASDPERDFETEQDIIAHAVRAIATTPEPGLLVLTWNLPEPAARVRIHLPTNAFLEVKSLKVVGRELASVRSVVRLLLAGLAGAMVLVLVRAIWRPVLIRPVTVKHVLLMGLFLTSSTVTFLLPPFQGPDEIAHWKTALTYCGRSAQTEKPLFYLNEILGTTRLRFHAENQFDAEQLRADADRISLEVGPPPVEYAGFFTYPTVTAVSLFFPHVDTLNEALTFYYTCRFLPVVLLFIMLLIANRRDELPYTAIWFFSLPLVLQQHSVISTDTLMNLGTLAAVLLFLQAQLTRRWFFILALWFACLAVGSAKQGVGAAIFLLPLSLIPFHKISHKKIVVPLVGLLVVVAGYFALRMGVDLILGHTAGTEQDAVAQQIRFLSTGEGIATFIRAYFNTLPLMLWHPLGWLDTYLNHKHLLLIYVSGVLALLLDLIAYGGGFPIVWRERKRQAAILLTIIVANFLFLSVSVALSMYIAVTEPEADYIVGYQSRYLFPAVILALFLPMMVLKQPPVPPSPSPSANLGEGRGGGLTRLVMQTTGIVLFGWLLFARHVELTMDLLIRYW